MYSYMKRVYLLTTANARLLQLSPLGLRGKRLERGLAMVKSDVKENYSCNSYSMDGT